MSLSDKPEYEPEPVIQKIKLPYPYQHNPTGLAYIEGWSETPGCLIIRLAEQASGLASPSPASVAHGWDWKFNQLDKEATKRLLSRLGLSPENVPGYKPANKVESVKYVKLEEWEAFQRWREARKEIQDIGDDNLSNFRELLKSITDSCPEFDDDFDDLLDGLRRLPRMIRYINTGQYPPTNMEDEDIAYYDETHNLDSFAYDPGRKKKKLIVEVHIEDISDGKL